MTTSSIESTAQQRAGVLLKEGQQQIQLRWLENLRQGSGMTGFDSIALEDLCSQLLDQLVNALAGDPAHSELPEPTRNLLTGISTEFADRGLTPKQTASFVFGVKRHLKTLFANDPLALFAMHEMVDAMGLFSMDAFISRREQIILRQTQELLEVSVPVVPLWEGILSLPIIGTLDSSRAQAITEKLLHEIARTNSRHALLDISGVPSVDTQTAQYLAKTVAAARLMGAECVITGISPTVAQVMVSLGITMMTVETRFSLAEGLRYCFAQQGLTVKRQEA